MTDHPYSSTNMLRRIIRSYLRPHWRTLVFALLCMVLAAAMTGALAKLMEPIIDDVFTTSEKNMIWPVACGVVGAFIFRGFATYGHNVLLTKVGQSIVADIQNSLFSHMVHADMEFFQANNSGQLTSRMINDVNMMRLTVAESLTGLGKSAMTMIFLIIVMFVQDWKLALIAFIIFPLVGGIVIRLGKKLRKVSKTTQIELGHFTAFLNQTFQSIRQVKAYGMEDAEIETAKARTHNLYKLACKTVRVSALSTPISEAFSGMAIAVIVVYGGWQVANGYSTTGALFSFITAFMLAYEPMKKLAKLNSLLQQGLAASERVFELIDTPPKIPAHAGASPLKLQDSHIAFEHVSFAYPDGSEALKDISLRVPSGKTVALVGPSGSGKSTLLNLVLRFFDVNKGTLRIGGHDIRNLELAALRQNMALVSQHVALFDDTIASNIRYSKPDASDDEVVIAAKAAAAHDFICQLENGYNTHVGEAGLKLSGGQRQRIAIARAMLRNAPILLLDEATSALDSESEKQVQDALSTLQKGRTTIAIAHRLSTIRHADHIYVLQNGRIVEDGSHDHLVKQGGLYAHLWHLQGGLAATEKAA